MFAQAIDTGRAGDYIRDMDTKRNPAAIVEAKQANDPQVALEVLRGIATGSAYVNAGLVAGLELTGNVIAAGIARQHVATTNARELIEGRK